MMKMLGNKNAMKKQIEKLMKVVMSLRFYSFYLRFYKLYTVYDGKIYEDGGKVTK